MKKWMFLVVIVLVIICVAIGFSQKEKAFDISEPGTEEKIEEIVPEAEVKEPTGEEPEYVTDDTESESSIVEISVEDVKGITAQKAEELCYLAMGEKDETTGFPFSFGVSGAVEKDGRQYYTIRGSWLVDNSHMSYIGDFFVSADGKEVYTGIALSGDYEFGNKIWSE